jgi:hypothetical protein
MRMLLVLCTVSIAAAMPPTIDEGRTELDGDRPVASVHTEVREHLSKIETCGSSPGTVAVSFLVEPDGHADAVRVEGGTHPSSEVRTCVARTFEDMSFGNGAEALVRVVVDLAPKPAR